MQANRDSIMKPPEPNRPARITVSAQRLPVRFMFLS